MKILLGAVLAVLIVALQTEQSSSTVPLTHGPFGSVEQLEKPPP